MTSPRRSRPPDGFGRIASIASSSSSGNRDREGLARSATTRTMSTVSGSVYSAVESLRSHFQGQLHEMAVDAGIPLSLPRPLLSLPDERAIPPNPSDAARAKEFLMSFRPKRVIGGKSTKVFTNDEILLALDKAVQGKKPLPVIEALLQLVEPAGLRASTSSSPITADKRGQMIPKLDDIFNRAAQSGSLHIWRLFLGRVSEKALHASLASALTNHTDEIDRIRSLLEYGANPELCQDRVLDLIASGSEDLVEILLLSPLVKSIDFLSQGLVRAASSNFLRNISMLLFRGADANFNHARALKEAVSAQNWNSALAIVTLAKTPISSSNLDQVTGLIGSWSQESQKLGLRILLYAGASGPRTSKTLLPFIAEQDEGITSILIECPAFRHSTFPAPMFFQSAVNGRNLTLASEVLRSSNNRSFSDYASTGVHLQLVRDYSDNPEQIHEIISELLRLGAFGDHTSQMLVECCSGDHLENPEIMSLVTLLIHDASAKASYSDGAALTLAIDAANSAVVEALMAANPTKKILSSAVSRTSSHLRDGNPAKLDILSILLDAGASGPAVDQELIVSIDNTPHALKKVKILLKSASLDHADGNAVVKAVQLERLDLLEIMLSKKTPQFITFTSIWKQIRKQFALTESEDGHLPYSLSYMQKIFEVLHDAAKGATPLNELLLVSTQCASKDTALGLTKLLLRWGASPNHTNGTPLQACIKRSDKRTLAVLLSENVTKTSLKYGFREALLLRGKARHSILERIIDAGLEKASLDEALPQVLREKPYDGPTVHLLVAAGARLHSSFGENLVPPSTHLDVQIVEKLLPVEDDKDSLLLPLKAVLSSHADWQSLDGESLPMVKLLIENCGRGAWADRLFMTAVKNRNQHSMRLFGKHLTSDAVYSETLHELLKDDITPLDRKNLSLTQFLLKNGARGEVIDESFVRAAQTLDLDWICALHPYLSDRSVTLSAFDIAVNTGAGTKNRLEIIQFLLKQGLDAPVINEAFVKAISDGDYKQINELLPFVSSKDTLSESLRLLIRREEVLFSKEGLAVVKLILSKGVSDNAVANVARTAARFRSLAGIELVAGTLQRSLAIHSAFEQIMEDTQPLKFADSRKIFLYLLKSGLGSGDLERVACVAASTYDLEMLKAILPACNDEARVAELAFGSLVLKDGIWTSPEELEVVSFLLGSGAKGLAVEEAAAHAAKTSNFGALAVLFKYPVAVVAIPAAFKALSERSPVQASSEQLTLASILVKQGVSAEVLTVAAVEMAKSLSMDGLKALSQSPHFSQVTDVVLQAILQDEDLGRTTDGQRITEFLLEKGVSAEGVEVAASRAAAALNFDTLHNILESNSSQSAVESAFLSLVGLEKGWLCPEGIRIAKFLLVREPSEHTIDRAFIQASQYLHFDAVKLLNPNLRGKSVLNEAFQKALGTGPEWLSALDLVKLFLDSGIEGDDVVELAFLKGSRALNYPSLELLAPYVNHPEIFTKALAEVTEHTQEWRQNLEIVQFLIGHGAIGEPVDKAYLHASEALDLQAVQVLQHYVGSPDIHSQAFRAAISNESWLSIDHLPLLEHLFTDDLPRKDVASALVSAAESLNLAVVELLSQKADEEICAEAFTAATRDLDKWTSTEGSKVVQVLAQKGASGGSVDEAFINSARLFRLDLVTELAQSKKSQECVSRACDALLSTDDPDSTNPDLYGQDIGWLANEDALRILELLFKMGAKCEFANGALVRAAQSGSVKAVDILARVVDDPQAFTDAFNAITKSTNSWLHKDYFALVQILLSCGIAGESLNNALVNVVTSVIDELDSKNVLELLLKHGADVNFDDGKCLQLAAQNGKQDLFKSLLRETVKPHSLYMALKAALNNNFDEEKVLSLFQSVAKNESIHEDLDVNYHPDTGFPLLFYCLSNYPASARLTEEICELKADLSATILWDNSADEHDELLPDRIPPLHVALEKDCSDEVIDVLLSHGADINYTPEQSMASALMLAAGKGRASVVSSLLNRGARVSQKDARERTSLCYAARNGDILTLKTILKKNPPVDDGSLHEAARELHADAVKLLIQSGHDIHFPSSKHDGRSPLCELCYACKASQDPEHLERTLAELTAAKAQPLRKSRGRTAIFMAMENANPVPVVTALIEVCKHYRDLDDPRNVYEEEDYFYSPTMYIKKGIIRQSEAIAAELLDKLQLYSEIDRYYAKERMQQPEDACGMPPRIQESYNRQWMRESRREEEDEDWERKMKRQEQEMATRQHFILMEEREKMGQQQSIPAVDARLPRTRLRDRDRDRDLGFGSKIGLQKQGWDVQSSSASETVAPREPAERRIQENENLTQKKKLATPGQELGMESSGPEAPQPKLKFKETQGEEEPRRQSEVKYRGFPDAGKGVGR